MMTSPRRALSSYLRERRRKYIAAVEESIPKVPLRKEHVEHCSVVLDRRELLERIGTGGTVVELGVNEGEFSEQILEICQPAHLHLVDMWGTDRYHEGLHRSVCEKFAARIDEGQVVVHRGASTDVVDDFADASLDWVYIDSNHSYRVTRDELRAYESKVKPGGIMAGHDYSQGNWVDTIRYGVIEAVHEFCVQRGWELVHLTVEPLERQSFAIRRIT